MINPFKTKKAKKVTSLIPEEETNGAPPGWYFDIKKKDPIKICLVGDCDVGKKSIIAAMLNKKSIPPKNSVYDFHECKVKVGSDTYDCELMEADAGPQHDRLRGLSYPYVNVFILCYSVVDRETLQHIEERWLKEIFGNTQFGKNGEHVPLILCGTKSDLVEHHKKDKGRSKPITTNEAEFYAGHIKARAFVNTSSTTKNGLTEAYVAAIQASLEASRDFANAKGGPGKNAASDEPAEIKASVPPPANLNHETAKKKIVVEESDSSEGPSPRGKRK